MSGSVEGGHKAAAKNKANHGDDYYERIGRKGGAARVPKGFGVDRELARRAGAIGGRISRLPKKADKMESTWTLPNYRSSNSTTSTRRVRCASCKELFDRLHLDDMGLCMTCPVDEHPIRHVFDKLRPF